MGKPKQIAKTLALGLALYIGTAVCFLIIFLIGWNFVENDLVGDWLAAPAIGWFYGPLPMQDLQIGVISGIAWQLLTVSSAAFLSRRVGRATRLGWKVAVPLYILLILLTGFLANFFGLVADSNYGPLHNMRF